MADGRVSAAAVSVVVPAHNAGLTLSRCLDAVTRAATADVEVIVVDDGSSDETGAIARRYGAQVVRLDVASGPARARNRGVAASGGTIVLFVDADVVMAADGLMRTREAFEADPHLVAVFGSYDDAPSAGTLVSDYRNLLHHFVHQQSQVEAVTFWAGLGAVRRDVFTRCGGFDERFVRPSIEDIELGARLVAAGHRVRLDKQLRGTHLKRWTLAGMVRTDVLARARPWTLLMLRRRGMPRDLNLQWRHRASGVLVWLAVALCAAAAMLPGPRGWLAAAGLAALALLAVLNAAFYRFLVGRRGLRFALAAYPLHALYYAYASGTFAWCCVEYGVMRLRRRASVAPWGA